MNWKNEEQYEDHTAARAMLRVMTRDPDELDALDDDGCLRLIIAVVRQAMEDHFLALRKLPDPAAVRLKKETEAFFRSEHCYLLTGIRGRKLLEMIGKEAEGI